MTLIFIFIGVAVLLVVLCFLPEAKFVFCPECGINLKYCRQLSTNVNYCWEWDEMENLPETIDPVCLVHGKKWSEHEDGKCIICCLCFSDDFEPWEDENGVKWDICVNCKKLEDAYAASLNNTSVDSLRHIL